MFKNFIFVLDALKEAQRHETTLFSGILNPLSGSGLLNPDLESNTNLEPKQIFKML
jgi:hypothetical protein